MARLRKFVPSKIQSFSAEIIIIIANFSLGVDSMPLDLQRYVSRLREVELEKKGTIFVFDCLAHNEIHSFSV